MLTYRVPSWKPQGPVIFAAGLISGLKYGNNKNSSNYSSHFVPAPHKVLYNLFNKWKVWYYLYFLHVRKMRPRVVN